MATRFVVDFGGEEEIPEPESTRSVSDVWFVVGYTTLGAARDAASYVEGVMKNIDRLVWLKYHPPDSDISWFGFGFDHLQPYMKGRWIDAISRHPIPPKIVEAWKRSGYKNIHVYSYWDMAYIEELTGIEFP